MDAMLARLERVTTRLEILADKTASSSGQAAAAPSRPSKAGHAAGNGVDAVQPKPAACAPALAGAPAGTNATKAAPAGSASSEFAALRESWTAALDETARSLDAEVKSATECLSRGLAAMQGVIDSFPTTAPSPEALQELVKPVADQLMAAQELRQGPRTRWTNHKNVVAESIQGFAWLVYTGPQCGMQTPEAHVGECWSSAELYANKVLMEYRKTDPQHVAWVGAVKAVFVGLRGFVSARFPSGPVWGSRAEDEPGRTPAASAPVAGVDASPPPAPPPAATPKVDAAPPPAATPKVDAYPPPAPTPAATPEVDASPPSAPTPAATPEVDASPPAAPTPAVTPEVDASVPAAPTPAATPEVDASVPAAPTPAATPEVDASPPAAPNPAATPEVDASPPAAPTPAATPKVGGPPPPPPPPKPGAFFENGAAADGARPAPAAKPAAAAFLDELKASPSVTAGLRKVTDDMKTKNRAHRTGAVVTGTAATRTPGGGALTRGPPSMALQQRRWVVENYDSDNAVVLPEDQLELKHSVYIAHCRDCVVQIKAKVNNITLDNCHRVGLLFDAVVSSCELVNCASMQVQCTGMCPTLAIDKTDGVQVYLSLDCLSVTEITTSKSSGVNMCVPPAEGEEDDMREHPLPEQFISRFVDGKFVTEAVCHSAG